MEKDPHDGMNDHLRPEYDLSQLLCIAEDERPWPDFPKTGTKIDARRMCFEQGKAFVYMPPTTTHA